MCKLISKLLFVVCFLFAFTAKSQTSYFPPNTGDTWDTIHPASLNWCEERIDSLYTFLAAQNSKGFILLKDGKIVLEQYFNGHSATSPWYWASAGKTLTSFLVGIAQQENYLSITDTTSTYLGTGWTNCTPEQEEKITIWNQLTMTSGLDDGVADHYCTLDTCLNYLANPGTRWAYHNGPYTLLDNVIESAVGVTLNQYATQKLKNPTGMTGSFFQVDYNSVFFSTARSMARFGLLIKNNGNWNGNQIMTDATYFNDMLNTSQNLNKSYGYLWWLNGKPSFMLPGLQTIFPFSMLPNAPDDALMALGKDGQFINVSQSENLVWIRMGESPENSDVPFLLNDAIWEYIHLLGCEPVGITSNGLISAESKVSPNPFSNKITVHSKSEVKNCILMNAVGQLVWSGTAIEQHDFTQLPSGIYLLKIASENGEETLLLHKE
jgi:CubicO group peptidase (beta-lactamase class C family)